MRRWNGWGDEADHFALSEDAQAFLTERLGPSRPPRDATLEQALQTVPDSRLPAGTPFQTDVRVRLLHARGQSFPDWLAMRSGQLGPYADGVALPTSHDEAAQALAVARRVGALVVPYGGGTSVVGHLSVPVSDRPVVNISLERMNRLLAVDERSLLATLGAGTPGPQIEAQLRPHGFLLGHFPQSYEYSTVGGWVVTRSSGQQSLRYGRIEQMFAAGRVITPRGELRVGGVPASSAGPDLRELILGSEGRLGLLTEVTVRVRRIPAVEDFHGVFFPNWDVAIEAVRAMVQADLPLSMLRLSNEVETETQLRLAGHPERVRWLQRYLGMRGIQRGQCMLMMGITGSAVEVRRTRRDALAIAKRFRGVHVGKTLGKSWAKNRFRGPLLRNSLWELGYAVDTVETAVNWPKVTALMRGIEQAAREALATDNERVHAFTHLSHMYRQGCSIYSTFVWRAAGDPAADLERWRRLKTRVSETIVAHGGTISHQHGVGLDHAPYLPAEKGALGMDLIRAAARELDPDQMMNPGKLFA
ncbi:alkyldihydroxyacetonephosphate synthase [Fontimonas thermophila]|uniref:Alkyldihydroxyacetonephosphate synthase n=1 Tax=Fontimonas thermophila TaxID=1076937 RepID=A0A1I2HWE1_9GAMM|nr:FAD-binding oxidoreductase [Fontimonas thermophila]SFF34132.1 alkyldihydroxyacetonephosphate synthase [Fontimonas thermophila]